MLNLAVHVTFSETKTNLRKGFSFNRQDMTYTEDQILKKKERT